MVGGPVAIGAISELIAAAVASAAGLTWKSARRSPEERALRDAVNVAVADALRDAVLPTSSNYPDGWLDEVARLWQTAFTAEVCAALVACLADPSGDAATRFADKATTALVGAGCDLGELARTFWMEEFLALLPRRLFAKLTEASMNTERLRPLVGHVLLLRSDARARVDLASPSEIRQDISALLRRLDTWACTLGLPRYLGPEATLPTLARAAWVRAGIRSGKADDTSDGSGAKQEGRAYQLPAERLSSDPGPRRPWLEVAAEHRCLMVLADPGLGKSWLVRTETHRLACRALADLDFDLEKIVVPIPMRCEQLVTAAGMDLAEKAAACLVAGSLLASRSANWLASRVRAGQAVLLLDALDELSLASSGLLRDLLQSWAGQAGDQARCVITSRISGFTGSPIPHAFEVELQPFTQDDVGSYVAATPLSHIAVQRVVDSSGNPAMAAMARNPLLLALLCAVAAETPAVEALPRTRGQLYERVLRWFLTQEHRSSDDPGTPLLASFEVDALLAVLAPVAFSFAVQPGGWADSMTGDRLLAMIWESGPAGAELGGQAAATLRGLSVDAGILVPDIDPSAGRSPRYMFLHRTVAEYLVARHLAAMPTERMIAVVDQHRWFDHDWSEVIPLLGELLQPSEARILIEHFLACEIDPFHQSVLTALRLWGARPDVDQLLPSPSAEKLTEEVMDLLARRTAYSMWDTRAQLNAVPNLPETLITRLLRLLSPPDEGEYRLPFLEDTVIDVLAQRDAPGVTEALLNSITDVSYNGSKRQAAGKALARRKLPGVTDGLLRLLSDHDWPEVRSEAARALADHDGPAVTQGLLCALDDEDEYVRRAATSAVASRSGADVTSGLLRKLADPDDWVRQIAGKALADRDDSRVTDFLLRYSRRRNAGVNVVAALAARDDPRVTSRLVSLLRHPSSAVRAAAVKAIANRNDADVAEGLLAGLHDADVTVAASAAQALAQWSGPEVTASLLNVVNDPRREVRVAAVKALANRDDQAATQGLIESTTDDDFLVQVTAIRGLAGRDTPEITAAILGLIDDPGYVVRFDAVEALTGRHTPAVVAAMLGRLADSEGSIRSKARAALAELPDSSVTDALLGLLNDADQPTVRVAAAKALSGRGGPEVTTALLSLLNDADQPGVRAAVAEALSGRAGPEVTTVLLSLLNDQDYTVRLAAARALKSRPEPAVAEALMSLLGDPRRAAHLDRVGDGNFRTAAVRALGAHAGPHVTMALLELLNDPYGHMREPAVVELARRKGSEVTDGLMRMAMCSDPGPQRAAVDAVIAQNQPEALMALIRQAAVRESAPNNEAIDLARRLTWRYYPQLDPPAQEKVRRGLAHLVALYEKRA